VSRFDPRLLRLPPKIGVNRGELWEEITKALAAIVEDLDQTGAAVYLASRNDYTEFQLVASTGAQASVSLALPTYDAFAWILEEGKTALPTTKREMSWLDPGSCFGAPYALLLGHETVGGNLLLAVFLSDKRVGGSVARRLQHFTGNRLFPYIATAMFGIELDTLTAEVGHLMGRATGKIHAGIRTLRAQLRDCKVNDPETVALAYQAADEGLRRLDLIRQNFYQFGLQRRAIAPDGSDAEAEAFDVIPILKEMMGAFKDDARAMQLRPPIVEFRATSAVVRGPIELLRIAFLNLYDNALKFSYANTFVHITAGVDDGMCVIAVENLGVGVAPDEFTTIFQRLRRSRFRDPHRRIEGLGLGLAYCRRVVEELFHGRISLTSRPIDTRYPRRFEGDNWLTTVTVELPLHTKELTTSENS
jgi:signal transduction histidine kinase